MGVWFHWPEQCFLHPSAVLCMIIELILIPGHYGSDHWGVFALWMIVCMHFRRERKWEWTRSWEVECRTYKLITFPCIPLSSSLLTCKLSLFPLPACSCRVPLKHFPQDDINPFETYSMVIKSLGQKYSPEPKLESSPEPLMNYLDVS